MHDPLMWCRKFVELPTWTNYCTSIDFYIRYFFAKFNHAKVVCVYCSIINSIDNINTSKTVKYFRTTKLKETVIVHAELLLK